MRQGVGPFPLAASVYQRMSSELVQESTFFRGGHELGSGETASALEERCHRVADSLLSLHSDADTTAQQCDRQGGHDAALAQAPSPADVAAAKESLIGMTAAMRSGQVPPSMVTSTQDSLRDLISARAAAVREHADRTSETSFPQIASETTSTFGEKMANPVMGGLPTDQGSGQGANEFLGSGSSTEYSGDVTPQDSSTGNHPSAGETQLSADSLPGVSTPAGPPQPTQPLGQLPPAVMAPPQMSGYPMTGAMPGMPPIPTPTAAGAPVAHTRQGEVRPNTSSPGYPEPEVSLPDWSLDTSISADDGWVPERGSSISGVTTRGDVSGVTPPVVSAGGGGGGFRGAVAGAPMVPPMMPMGAMGALGAMGGAGGSVSGKERPVILADDRESLASETMERAVDAGLISGESGRVTNT